MEGRESLWISPLGKRMNLIKNKILSCKFRNWLFSSKNCCFASVLSIWKECCRCKPGNFPSRGWKSLLPPLFFLNCAAESLVNINAAARNLLFINHLGRAQTLHRLILPQSAPGAGDRGNIISFHITWSPVFFPQQSCSSIAHRVWPSGD